MRVPIGGWFIIGIAGAALSACLAPPGPPLALQSRSEPAWQYLTRTFGEPARAGMAPALVDWRRTRLGPGGQIVQEAYDQVRAVTVAIETLAARWAPEGQGALRVGLAYRNHAGQPTHWLDDPVRVTYELWTGDGSQDSPILGQLITSGEAHLDPPNRTFSITYPLPEQARPPVYGVLKGRVHLPNGKVFPFREAVVRRSPWVP